MPKTTTSFLNQPDYQEAYLGKGYAYMGRKEHLKSQFLAAKGGNLKESNVKCKFLFTNLLITLFHILTNVDKLFH